MKAIHGGGRIAATTCVHVELKGSLDIPLNLSLLADLGDPMVEQEIIKEAVRIAVSERLGCFGGVEVHLSSSGGREGGRAAAALKARQGEAQMQPQEAEATASSHSYDMENGCRGRYCEARVNLVDLGRCIESIQKAYEGLLMHAQLLHELLNTETATAPSGAADAAVTSTPQSQQSSDFDAQADAVKRLAAARQLVANMVADHRSGVVAEAEALQDGASPQRLASHETDMLADEHAETTAMIHAKRYGKRPSHDDDTDAGLRFGLLAGGNEDAEEQQRRQQAEAREGEEELRARYMELGYSPL